MMVVIDLTDEIKDIFKKKGHKIYNILCLSDAIYRVVYFRNTDKMASYRDYKSKDFNRKINRKRISATDNHFKLLENYTCGYKKHVE